MVPSQPAETLFFMPLGEKDCFFFFEAAASSYQVFVFRIECQTPDRTLVTFDLLYLRVVHHQNNFDDPIAEINREGSQDNHKRRTCCQIKYSPAAATKASLEE